MTDYSPDEGGWRRTRWALALVPLAVLIGGGTFFWLHAQNEVSSTQGRLARRRFVDAGRRRFAGGDPRHPSGPGRRLPPSWGFTARPTTKAERAAAVATIRAQLDAFAARDWPKSLTYRVGGGGGDNAQRFGEMILQGYSLFANFKRVEFGPSQVLGNHIMMPIRLTGRNGQMTYATYDLQKDKGVWRVAGVGGGASGDGRRGDSRRDEDDMGGGNLVS